ADRVPMKNRLPRGFERKAIRAFGSLVDAYDAARLPIPGYMLISTTGGSQGIEKLQKTVKELREAGSPVTMQALYDKKVLQYALYRGGTWPEVHFNITGETCK